MLRVGGGPGVHHTRVDKNRLPIDRRCCFVPASPLHEMTRRHGSSTPEKVLVERIDRAKRGCLRCTSFNDRSRLIVLYANGGRRLFVFAFYYAANGCAWKQNKKIHSLLLNGRVLIGLDTFQFFIARSLLCTKIRSFARLHHTHSPLSSYICSFPIKRNGSIKMVYRTVHPPTARLLTSKKCGRRRPIVYLPTSVNSWLTAAPNPNMPIDL